MAFDPFTAGFDLAKTVLDKFFPDANEEMKGKLAQASMEIQNQFALQLGQINANTEEAKHSSIFVAGARPAVMWVCVTSLLYSGIITSLLTWVSLSFGLAPIPLIDIRTQENLLYALLGIGGMRTVDKINRVETTRMKK